MKYEGIEAGVKPVEEPSPSSVRQEVSVSRMSPGEGGLVVDRPASNPKPVAQVAEATEVAQPPEAAVVTEVAVGKGSTGDGGLVADRPASNPEPVSLVAEVGPEQAEVALQDEVEYCLKKDDGLEDLEFPPVRQGPGDRAKLVEEVRRNPKLRECRSVAERDSCMTVVTEAVKVPGGKPVAVKAGAVKAVRRTVKAAKPRRQRRVAGLKPSSLTIGVVGERGPGKGGLVVDRPARNPQTVPQVAATTGHDSAVLEVESGKEDEWPDWAGMTNTEEGEPGMVIQDQGELQGEVEYCLREGGEVEDSEVLPVAGVLVCQARVSLCKGEEQIGEASIPLGKREAECCDSGDTKQLTDELVSGMSEAKGRPSSLGEGAIEPGMSAMTGGEDDREAEWVPGKLARVAEEEPKAKKMIGLAEKQLVKLVTRGDHTKEDEAADKVGRAAEAVIEERGGRGDTASGKCVDILQPQSSVVDRAVDIPNRQDEVAAVRQKVRLKPVRALEVILRANALEQARPEKFKLDMEEKPKLSMNKKFELDEKFEVNEKFKLDGLEVTSEEARVKDLCGIKDDVIVEVSEDSLSRREKGFDRESTVLSSMSSVPTPSVVCWPVEELEACTGRKVSGIDVHLHTIPTQDWDSRFGDPEQRAVGNLREGPLDPGQQKSGGGVKTRFGDSRQQEARGVSTSFGDSRQLEAGEGTSERSDDPWMQQDEGVGNVPGLRPAPSCVVGGDVGPEVPTDVRSGYSWCSPPRKMYKRCRKRRAVGDKGPESPQMDGVATSGVALQGQEEEQQPTEVAVCKDQESSVQRAREQCARSPKR